MRMPIQTIPERFRRRLLANHGVSMTLSSASRHSATRAYQGFMPPTPGLCVTTM